MRIRKLDMIGFKSFHDKTTIQFPQGISAVVGPNGCGKSNIVDALRWVMGEQSAKTLRGKAMEDIIFSGANGKPPLNMAEVSMTLSNEDGTGPEEFKDLTEIMITRRQYRSGERAYFINRRPCRLKDIYNVFLGSGMGAKSYAIIQQGNIGAITDAGPLERRVYIEEAAGITRYKNRKIEALRKLDATQQNLLRVSDIISEINRQMASLKRQARKAELFNRTQERIRILDILLSIVHYDRFTDQIVETGRMLDKLKDADVSHSAELKKIDAAIEDIKFKREQKNQALTDKKGRRYDAQRSIDRMENDLTHLRDDIQRLTGEIKELESARSDITEKSQTILSEIGQVEQQIRQYEEQIARIKADLGNRQAAAADTQRRYDTANQQLETAKTALLDLVAQEARYSNIIQNANRNKENLDRRLKRVDEEEAQARQAIEKYLREEKSASDRCGHIQSELAAINAQIEEARKRLETQNRELSSQIKKVQSQEYEHQKRRSHLATLKKMESSYEWYKDGVRAVMTTFGPDAPQPEDEDASASPPRIIGLVSDIIETDAAYETAVEAVLGESLQYILIEDVHSGHDVIRYLKEAAAGRCGLIPISDLEDAAPPSTPLPDGVSPLLDHVRIKPGREPAARVLLGGVFLVDSLPAAAALRPVMTSARMLVTADGDILTAQGFLLGGSQKNLSGILSKKKEIRDLEKTVAEAEKQLKAAHENRQELEAAVRATERSHQQMIEKRNQLVQDEIAAEKDLYRVGEDLKHARRQLEVIQVEQEQIAGEFSDVDEEMEKTNRLIGQIADDTNAAQETVRQASAEINRLSADIEQHNKRIVEKRMEMTSATAGLENSRHTLRRLQDFHADGLNRLEQTGIEINRKAEKVNTSTTQIEAIEKSLQQLYREIATLDQTVEVDEEEFRTLDQALKENDAVIADLQSRRESTQQKMRVLEIELSQLQIKRENVDTRVLEHYRQPIEALRTGIENDPDIAESTAGMSVEQMETSLERNRRKIASIADVNLGAIKEYEQLHDRFDFLSEQREDLEKAIADLHKVIKKINRITQEKFLETFEAVNDQIKKVFPRLFEGGSAKLSLTDPNNPLETGVEFLIHPPGKKLTRMSLLSGGEKALSAIAFIFSLFFLKPTAFCLMDEIDAPLDDANVYRFNNLLKIIGEKTQIIMITHNKSTMEFADTLFGVTMEKKGISQIVSVNFDRSGDHPAEADNRQPAHAAA